MFKLSVFAQDRKGKIDMKVKIEIDMSECSDSQGNSLEGVIMEVIKHNISYHLKKSPEYKNYIKTQTDIIIEQLGESR